MLTLWCLTVAFATPWAVGAPLLWLLRGRHAPRPGDWLWVPFVGLAGLVVVLHPPVAFADVPLRHTAPWFAAAVAVGWAVMLSFRSGRATVRAFPVRAGIATLVVYLAAAFGVLAQGVERYRGNMQSDQYQYVALAAFVSEEPVSTNWAEVGQRPWLIQPVVLSTDRLGQSVIHGALAVVAGRDPLDLYFPVQAVGVALLCPAVLLLAQQFRLRRWLALGVAVTAALAPGVAVLQSCCFLSHLLCLPALVAYLAGVVRLSRGGGPRPLLGVAAAFVVGLAVYPEFAPLFVGVAAAGLTVGLAVRTVRVRRVAAVAAALVAACAVAPAAVAQVPRVWERSAAHGGQMSFGLPVPVTAACVWVQMNSAGMVATAAPAVGLRTLVYGGFAAAALGACGFALWAARNRPAALPAPAATASLVVPPLVLLAVKPASDYMIGKLLWTLTPVLVVFVVCAAVGLGAVARRAGLSRRAAGRVAGACFACFAVALVYHTAREGRNYLEPAGARARMATAWNEPALTGLCAWLRSHPADDVLVALPPADELMPVEVTSVCYHARHHRVWLASPDAVWGVKLICLPVGQVADLGTVPPGAAVVLPRGAAPPTAEVVFHNDRYEVARFAALDRATAERLRADAGRR